MTVETEEKHKIIKMYMVTPRGEEFDILLRSLCNRRGIDIEQLPAFLMCVVKIPFIDIDYDEAYKTFVEKGYLNLEEHKVLTNRREVIHH